MLIEQDELRMVRTRSMKLCKAGSEAVLNPPMCALSTSSPFLLQAAAWAGSSCPTASAWPAPPPRALQWKCLSTALLSLAPGCSTPRWGHSADRSACWVVACEAPKRQLSHHSLTLACVMFISLLGFVVSAGGAGPWGSGGHGSAPLR